MPFEKGNIANPEGRKPTSKKEAIAFMNKARKLGPKALERLEELLYADNESVCLRAACAIIERAYGKAPSEMMLLDHHGRPIDTAGIQNPPMQVNIIENLNDGDLRKDLRAAFTKARERKGRDPKAEATRAEPEQDEKKLLA